jgi:hypothetical protein
MGSPRRRPRTAPLLCALTLLAAPAAAQPDPEDGDRVDAADLDLAAEADLRFQRGVALQQEGRYAEALEHYLLSQRLVSNRNVAFNIAVCFEALERFDLAYRYFDQYRLEARDAEERRAADDALTRIAPRVAVLHVTSEPPGAEVYLDRVDLGLRGRTPLDLPVDAGTHRILLRLEGYVPAEAAAEAVVGETRDVDAALRPIVGFVGALGRAGRGLGRRGRHPRRRAAGPSAAGPRTPRHRDLGAGLRHLPTGGDGDPQRHRPPHRSPRAAHRIPPRRRLGAGRPGGGRWGRRRLHSGRPRGDSSRRPPRDDLGARLRDRLPRGRDPPRHAGPGRRPPPRRAGDPRRRAGGRSRPWTRRPR